MRERERNPLGYDILRIKKAEGYCVPLDER
jgi:hypothetical protein